MSGIAENLHIGLTFCALSNGKFSFQSQKFSATDLGGDLVDTLLMCSNFESDSMIHPHLTVH